MKILKCDYCEKELGTYSENRHMMIPHYEPNEICSDCSAQLKLFKELRRQGKELTPSQNKNE